MHWEDRLTQKSFEAYFTVHFLIFSISFTIFKKEVITKINVKPLFLIKDDLLPTITNI